MKIINENLQENQIIVIPQDSDDLYYLYHILSVGDIISAKTSRKMKDTGDRIVLTIKLSVEETEFHGFGETIRVRGRILEASDVNVSLGSYHSITLELYNQVSITKEKWYPSQIDRLRDAQMGKSSPVIVIAMDDESALVTQIGTHASKVLLDLDPGIPRKGNDIDGHMRETLAYFNTLAIFMRTLREEEVAQYFVIGGPGFTKDAFFEHLKTNFSNIVTNVSIVEASSAGQNGVREIILSKIPDNFTAGQSAQNQSKLLQEVLEHLGTSTDKIAYGMNVKIAIGLGAVDKLLILDNKMHVSIETRNEIEELISQNKRMGGRTVLMSSFHDQSSREILEGLGGIVAILRFPLPK